MSGFVYAIEGDNGLIKIGFTRNLARRLTKMRSDNASLRPLAYIEATQAQEAELHGLLMASREKGEWFRPSALVMHAVEMMKPWPEAPRRRARYSSRPLSQFRQQRELSLCEGAALLCVTPAMWSRWETGARPIPAHRVLDIEKLTGVSRYELRPDVFGSAPARRSSAA